MNYDLSMQNIQIISVQHAEQNCTLCCPVRRRCVVSDSVTLDCRLLGSSVRGILQARKLEWVAMPSPGDLPNPVIEPRSLALQADSLLSEPPGKPKDSGVNSLSLLHCRWILYLLSYPGSLNYGLCTITTNIF